MPTDGNRGDQGGGPAGLAATLILLVLHGCLFAATFGLLGLLVMTTDPCGSVRCGDPAWVGRAMTLATWGGGAVLLLDAAVSVYLLAHRRRAFFVPIIGCVVHAGLVAAAVAMELQAGPV
ncbi:MULTISPECIES: hypothetical protein [unclassified Mycobacterium]|uniref:hypothetical protein n=1 Tax=unclassified Mycobacterium TaxID=2642494 RepID=UPI000B2B9630|nr:MULTISPECIES: hypothetical protein [unclassified Mycobacterium]